MTESHSCNPIRYPALRIVERMFVCQRHRRVSFGAHRGDRSQKPENTLSALASSIGKCDFIEIDVQLTKDLVPVIIHDETLERTSNVSNIERFKDRTPWIVSDFTLKELQSLDFGSWFNSEYESILTLQKALSFVKEKHLFLNVEIKDMSKTFSDEIVL